MARFFTLIEGGVANFDVLRNDPTATSATLVLKNRETEAVTSHTANYVDGVASIQLDGNDTAIVGVYQYQVNENLSGGGIAKYGTFDCDDCEWGEIVVCEALDGGIS